MPQTKYGILKSHICTVDEKCKGNNVHLLPTSIVKNPFLLRFLDPISALQEGIQDKVQLQIMSSEIMRQKQSVVNTQF